MMNLVRENIPRLISGFGSIKIRQEDVASLVGADTSTISGFAKPATQYVFRKIYEKKMALMALRMGILPTDPLIGINEEILMSMKNTATLGGRKRMRQPKIMFDSYDNADGDEDLAGDDIKPLLFRAVADPLWNNRAVACENMMRAYCNSFCNKTLTVEKQNQLCSVLWKVRNGIDPNQECAIRLDPHFQRRLVAKNTPNAKPMGLVDWWRAQGTVELPMGIRTRANACKKNATAEPRHLCGLKRKSVGLRDGVTPWCTFCDAQ